MRGAGIAVMAAVGGMLLSPASPLAGEPPVLPQAVLETPSTSLQAGKPLQLDSSASLPGSGAIVGHAWDLDGDGSFERDTGARPVARFTPKKAGPLTVQVRVLDDLGQSSDAKLDLNVTKTPKPGNGTVKELAGTSTGQGQGAASASARTTTTTPALVPRKHLRNARHATKSPTKARKPAATVTAAASTGVTIKNFAFTPGTSTVHAGDTITWSNQDIAPHTATAKDGSFDTGTINKGKSGSHTFTKAGSFPYICSIHPSMKGTVTVLASSTSGGTSSGSSGSNGSGSTATPSASSSPSSSSSSSSLPRTGFDIAVLVFMAMCLMGSGASLRRALR